MELRPWRSICLLAVLFLAAGACGTRVRSNGLQSTPPTGISGSVAVAAPPSRAATDSEVPTHARPAEVGVGTGAAPRSESIPWAGPRTEAPKPPAALASADGVRVGPASGEAPGRRASGRTPA